MQRFDPDRVDLARLARHLASALPSEPIGSIVGRTRLRDEVAHEVGCSLLEAEQLVDTLVARGFVAERQDPDGLVRWAIDSGAEDPR